MDRREFIKKSLYAGCAGMLCAGGYGLYSGMCKRKNDFFLIKSKEEAPFSARLDICSLCQLNCPECWRAHMTESDYKTIKMGYMPFSDFKRFVDKNDFIEKICISGSGELFLNPDFEKMLDYAFEHGIDMYSMGGVNLNDADERVLEKLVKYKFRKLVVSIDGATQETYKIYRVGGDLNKVINNIKIINKYKKQYNSKEPILVLKFIPFGHNEHEIDAVKKLAADLDMEIMFTPNYSPWYSPLKNPKLVEEKTQLISLNSYDYYLKNYLNDPHSFAFCNELVINPAITVDGYLLSCCMDEKHSNLRINVFEKGLIRALNDAKVLRLKYTLADFDFPKKSPFCEKCDFYALLKKRGVNMILK